jgi:hypothetical protein
MADNVKHPAHYADTVPGIVGIELPEHEKGIIS